MFPAPFVRQIGFVGLVEEDWLATLATIDSDELEYFDFVTMGTKLAKELRDEVLSLCIRQCHQRDSSQKPEQSYFQ